jgi:hypothetical protein
MGPLMPCSVWVEEVSSTQSIVVGDKFQLELCCCYCCPREERLGGTWSDTRYFTRVIQCTCYFGDQKRLNHVIAMLMSEWRDCNVCSRAVVRISVRLIN